MSQSSRPPRRAAVSPRLPVAVVLASLFGALCSPSALAEQGQGPSDPPFYTPPAELPEGVGQVIRSETVKYSKAKYKPPVGTKIWRILYTSTNALGTPIAVSGSILTSTKGGAPAAKRPLVSYALGSQGTGDTCAPSRAWEKGDVQDFLLINLLLGQGYNVVVSDYEGLGTPGVHAYAVNRSAAHSVLDIIRAARNFAPAGLSAAAPTSVYGYSQGGGAAAAVAEWAPSYAPEIALRGVAAGGVIADPFAVGESLDGGEYAGYLFAAAMGYDATYSELGLDGFLNERGRTERASASELCFDQMLSTYKGFRISDVTTSNPMETPAWRVRLAENSLGKEPPKMPVYMWHSSHDEVLPFEETVKLRRTWCGQGANVQWQPYRGLRHFQAAIVGAVDALRWTQERLRGRATRGNCGPLAPRAGSPR